MGGSPCSWSSAVAGSRVWVSWPGSPGMDVPTRTAAIMPLGRKGLVFLQADTADARVPRPTLLGATSSPKPCRVATRSTPAYRPDRPARTSNPGPGGIRFTLKVRSCSKLVPGSDGVDLPHPVNGYRSVTVVQRQGWSLLRSRSVSLRKACQHPGRHLLTEFRNGLQGLRKLWVEMLNPYEATGSEVQ